MSISKELSTRITDLIQKSISEFTSDPLNIRQLVAEEKVLPLFWDMGGVFAINANGDILSFLWDDTLHPQVEYDPRIRNIVLFQGSKKYPELKDLAPVKPDNAQVCPSCRGTGIEPTATKLNVDNIICYCGGLGWVP
jgi:hypothetical protein